MHLAPSCAQLRVVATLVRPRVEPDDLDVVNVRTQPGMLTLYSCLAASEVDLRTRSDRWFECCPGSSRPTDAARDHLTSQTLPEIISPHRRCPRSSRPLHAARDHPVPHTHTISRSRDRRMLSHPMLSPIAQSSPVFRRFSSPS